MTNKDFKCGSKVWLMQNNQPAQLIVRAVNTLERLQGDKDVMVLKEYFVQGIDAKVDPDQLFSSLEELLNSFKSAPSKSEGAKKGDNA